MDRKIESLLPLHVYEITMAKVSDTRAARSMILPPLRPLPQKKSSTSPSPCQLTDWWGCTSLEVTWFLLMKGSDCGQGVTSDEVWVLGKQRYPDFSPWVCRSSVSPSQDNDKFHN